MLHLRTTLYIAQAQSSQSQEPSMIDQSGEDLIYVGLGGLAIALVLIVGIFSRRFAETIIAAVVLSAFIILLVIFA
ncbi:MAG TPA: hypothetical protein IGS37_17680 [Synechococcales cyanobacterium M55_K2018_004]|nr:hypothetical protein [Synechococcales cyanobacterium M55_K2018_004]